MGKDSRDHTLAGKSEAHGLSIDVLTGWLQEATSKDTMTSLPIQYMKVIHKSNSFIHAC